MLRYCTGDIECGGVPTIVKVRNCLQNVAVGVERLRPADTTGRIPVRVQNDFGIDKVSGGDAFGQSFAKSGGSHHLGRELQQTASVIRRPYTVG